MTVSELNRAGRDEFTDAAGFAFENSPWIAAEAWEKRPFESVDDLHAAMVAVVAQAPREKQIALIVAHPDLAGRVAREGRLTPASRDEQSSAGLDRLSKEELTRFERLNETYRARFSFPFVICARENTKDSILAALEQRTKNDRAAEIATALREIAKIARLRLADLVSS